jgi:uncharacterized coiled-coil DUF342 family protein
LTNLEQELANLKEEIKAMRANVTNAAKNSDARAVVRETWAFKGEIGDLREAIAPSRPKLAVAEMRRSNEQRADELKQDNREHWEANDVVKGDVGASR